MLHRRFLPTSVYLLIVCLLLSGCASANSGTGGPTPTPLPTTTAPAFPVVPTQACRLARFEALRTRLPQGDLLAWSPDGAWLAFVAPASNSNWFAGSLGLLSAPVFDTPLLPAPDLLVFGSLAWAPDASSLAYVTFRQPDVYSVSISRTDGSPPRDIFSSTDPRTDTWGSSKVVQAWRSNTLIRILSSCGDDCDQTLEIDLTSGQVTPIGEQLRKAQDRLWPHANEREYDPEIFPVMWQENWTTRLSPQMKRPTWSPDGVKVAYIDRFLSAWVLRTDRKEQYILDTPYVDVQEMKWSPDGRYLALRTDDDVYVFDTECTP